jgi:hypothetical protein
MKRRRTSTLVSCVVTGFDKSRELEKRSWDMVKRRLEWTMFEAVVHGKEDTPRVFEPSSLVHSFSVVRLLRIIGSMEGILHILPHAYMHSILY